MTSLSTFWKFLQPGGFFGFGFLSSSALSFAFWSVTFAPPDWSGYSMSGASRQPIRVTFWKRCASVSSLVIAK
jgi:hypothetical protein